MRILLTNDDGIRAPGIVSLFHALADPSGELGGPIFGDETEIMVVAPETVQSATSHGVTFHEPLMARRVRVSEHMEGIAVDGRPADCVKLALSALWPERFGEGSRPDIVLSGINSGANCGVNVIYSGTVAAAIEAAFLGVPSIALSLHMGRGVALFDLAARHARRAVERLLEGGPLEAHECLNVNIPLTERAPGEEEDARGLAVSAGLAAQGPQPYEKMTTRDPEAMPPIRVCRMNTHGLIDAYERRTSPTGETYFWAAGGGLNFHATEPQSDVDLLFAGCITVTPLTYDMTRGAGLRRWADRLV